MGEWDHDDKTFGKQHRKPSPSKPPRICYASVANKRGREFISSRNGNAATQGLGHINCPRLGPCLVRLLTTWSLASFLSFMERPGRHERIKPLASMWDCQWVGSTTVTHKGGGRGGKDFSCLAYLSVMIVAMELPTNTIQVCISPTVVGVPALSRGDTVSSWGLGAMALMLGYGWVGKLMVDCLDRSLDPLGSALITLFAWDEGVSLLVRVPVEGLALVRGRASVSAAICHQHYPLEVM